MINCFTKTHISSNHSFAVTRTLFLRTVYDLIPVIRSIWRTLPKDYTYCRIS